MPTTTTDQGISLPVGADAANNPTAFSNFVAGVEPKLVRLYTDVADRTAKRAVVAENEISGLATENRFDVYNGADDISLYTRSLFATVRKTASQNVGPSNTTLQNVTDLVVALPAINGAIYAFRAVLFYDASTSADIKFAFTIPTGATMLWGLIGAGGGVATFGDPTWSTATASGTALAVGGNGVGTTLIAMLEGELTQSTNAGNLQLQAAQSSSDATATTVAARSRLQVWRTS
jgi:hypothetical protein